MGGSSALAVVSTSLNLLTGNPKVNRYMRESGIPCSTNPAWSPQATPHSVPRSPLSPRAVLANAACYVDTDCSAFGSFVVFCEREGTKIQLI
jgi:hypothetical protein